MVDENHESKPDCIFCKYASQTNKNDEKREKELIYEVFSKFQKISKG